MKNFSKLLDDIEEYLTKFGELEDFRVKFEKISKDKIKGYGFALFDKPKSMNTLLEGGRTHNIKGLTFECKQNLLREEILKNKYDKKDPKGKSKALKPKKKKKKRKAGDKFKAHNNSTQVT